MFSIFKKKPIEEVNKTLTVKEAHIKAGKILQDAENGRLLAAKKDPDSFDTKCIEKSWGKIEELIVGDNWRLDRLTFSPKKSDKLHAQLGCRHYCYVEKGNGIVHLASTEGQKNIASSPIYTDVEFAINNEWMHRYENTGLEPLVIIQISIGKFSLEELLYPV